MEVTAADRIIELATRWQEPRCWRDAVSALRLQSLEVKQAVLTEGEESRRCWDNVKTIIQELKNARDELHELAELARNHFPGLIHLVPTEDFCGESPPPREIIRWTENLRQIESQVREEQCPDTVVTVPSKRGRKTPTTKELMQLALINKPESTGWGITEWQKETKRSRGSIGGCEVWHQLESARKLGKTEKRTDRRQRRSK